MRELTPTPAMTGRSARWAADLRLARPYVSHMDCRTLLLFVAVAIISIILIIIIIVIIMSSIIEHCCY